MCTTQNQQNVIKTRHYQSAISTTCHKIEFCTFVWCCWNADILIFLDVAALNCIAKYAQWPD